MKYKVKIADKAYKVEAKNYEEALKIAKLADKSMKDETTPREVIQQLIDDEASATAAYNIAIKNLIGKLSDEAIAVLTAIRDDEERHSENLFAVMSGNITEKNLQDSNVKDADSYAQATDLLMRASAAAYQGNIKRAITFAEDFIRIAKSLV